MTNAHKYRIQHLLFSSGRKLSLISILVVILLSPGCGSGGGGANQGLTTELSDNNTSNQNGTNNPSSDTEQINAKPVAVIKGDINAKPGQIVNISGLDSFDPDGDILVYQWVLIASPTGSIATLSSTNTPDISISPDLDGLYRIQIVVNDGKVDSDPTTIDIIVSTPNSAPIASAGKDLSVDIGLTVALDGSASYDPDGDSLTYKWFFVSKPFDSQAELLNVSSPNPTFVPDQYTLTGNYVIQLIVSDGKVESAPDEVVITVPLIGVPPSTPKNLALSTGVATTQAGAAESWIMGMWDANTESDLREYEVSFKKDGENYYFYYVKNPTIKFQPVVSGATYFIRLRAVDKQGNVSAWTDEVSIIAAQDITPPSIPIGLNLTTGASFDNNGVTYIWIKATWNQNSETDVVAYKLRIKAGIDGQYYYGTSDTNELTFVNVIPGTTFYIGISAADSSGNQSEYTPDEPIVSASDIQ